MVIERSTASPTSMAGEIDALQLGHQRLHQVDGADDVGAGLPVENDQDGRFAVGEAGVAQIFDESVTSPTSDRRTGAPLR